MFSCCAALRTVLFVLALAALTCGAFAQTIGYRGDGTGVYRDCRPPLKWDERTGENVRWVAPLPVWGHGQPIVVAGRVYLLCEIGVENDFPLLLCLNAATGKELWRRELNPLHAAITDATERKPIADAWRGLRGALRKFRTAQFEAGDAIKTTTSVAGETAPELRISRAPQWKEAIKLCSQYGLCLDTMNDWLLHNRTFSCIGYGFAAPVSDGKSVWVATGLGGFFCFDLDGKLRWAASSPGNGDRLGVEFCSNGRSPILYKNLFISDAANLVRAFDRETGKLLWSDDGPHRKGGHAIVSPVVLTINGVDILWTAGCCAYRLPDGKPFAVAGWRREGFQALVKYDEPDVVFFFGEGEHGGWQCTEDDYLAPAAVRFSLAGDVLAAKVLWDGVEGESLGGYGPALVYHGGKLYNRGGVIQDAMTGKVVAGKFRGKGSTVAVPDTRQLLLIAGEHVYGFGPYKKTALDAPISPVPAAAVDVFTLDGKRVAHNVFACPKPTPEQRQMLIQTGGAETWENAGSMAFSWSCPFTFAGDCIYLRARAHLYCLGPK